MIWEQDLSGEPMRVAGLPPRRWRMEGHCGKGKRSVPGVGKSCNLAEPQCPHVQKKGRVPTVNHHIVLHIKM